LKRGIRLALNLGTNAIERLGNGIWSMSRHELDQRLRVQLAARNLQAFREVLGFVEELVRNGDGGFDTKSITAPDRENQGDLI
jgi:hypothetical protein